MTDESRPLMQLNASATPGTGRPATSTEAELSDPPDLSANREKVVKWEEWYQRLWKLKLSRIDEDHR